MSKTLDKSHFERKRSVRIRDLFCYKRRLEDSIFERHQQGKI